MNSINTFALKISLSIFFMLMLIVFSCGVRSDETQHSLKESSIEWNPNQIDLYWSKNGFQIAANKKVDNGQTYFRINQSLLFENYSSFFLNLEKGKTYLLETDILNEDSDFAFGIWVIQEGKTIAYSYASRGSTSVGAKFEVGYKPVEIKVGFKNRGLASVLVQKISLKKTKLATSNFRNSQSNTLYQDLKLKPFDSLHYHANVLSIVSYVNSFLISPLTRYYNHVGDDDDKRKILREEDSLKKPGLNKLCWAIPTVILINL